MRHPAVLCTGGFRSNLIPDLVIRGGSTDDPITQTNAGGSRHRQLLRLDTPSLRPLRCDARHHWNRAIAPVRYGRCRTFLDKLAGPSMILSYEIRTLPRSVQRWG